jgi:hypothetical protein
LLSNSAAVALVVGAALEMVDAAVGQVGSRARARDGDGDEMARMVPRPPSVPPPDNLPRSRWALLMRGCSCQQRPEVAPSSPRGCATCSRVSPAAA